MFEKDPGASMSLLVELGGKVAIVTGGGSGIGREIAHCLAQEGARVVVADVRLPPAEETAFQIKEVGGDAIAIRTDVSSPSQVSAMVSQTLGYWGQVDILVNNAGVIGRAPFLEMDEAEWDRVLLVNLKGAFLCGQVVARAMVQAGRGGKIVNITSVSSKVARRRLSHYCASKGGLHMLTKVMALELAPCKINVNAIAPGFIETPLSKPSLENPTAFQDRMSHIPWGRVGQPEDVAKAVLFLVSKEADYITGTALFVDGGWLIE